MKRIDRNRMILLVGIVLLVATSGCYTLLKHPDISNVKDYSAYDDGNYHNCARCHGGYIQPSPYDTYYHSDPWIDYYYFPWWYDDLWYMDYGDEATAKKREISEKRLIRSKLPLIPPEQLGTKRARAGTSKSLEKVNRNSSEKKREKTRLKNFETPKHYDTHRRNIIKSKPVSKRKTKSKDEPKNK
ncbi:MAG: hypothetical protein B6D63_01475 [Candidatus Latescibacteria bacterium 4484_7]|nr:MAG: hypothetical protein B6D63_01475 [Candidatus Latescibacteria bacterium 4484_7]